MRKLKVEVMGGASEVQSLVKKWLMKTAELYAMGRGSAPSKGDSTQLGFLVGGSARRGAAARGSTQLNSTKQGLVKQGLAKKGLAKKGLAKQGLAKQGSSTSRSAAVTRESISVVFVTPKKMQELNSSYRSKRYVTDILTFAPTEPGSVGELAICISKIKEQAKEHGLTFKEELGYMLTHGYLHALGYDHETSKRDAKRMFGIQDDLYVQLCQIFFKPQRRVKNVTAGRKRRSQKAT